MSRHYWFYPYPRKREVYLFGRVDLTDKLTIYRDLRNRLEAILGPEIQPKFKDFDFGNNKQQGFIEVHVEVDFSKSISFRQARQIRREFAYSHRCKCGYLGHAHLMERYSYGSERPESGRRNRKGNALAAHHWRTEEGNRAHGPEHASVSVPHGRPERDAGLETQPNVEAVVQGAGEEEKHRCFYGHNFTFDMKAIMKRVGER